MRPKYDGVKYYGARDYSIGLFFQKAQPILDSFSADQEFNNINEIIELFNIHQIILSGGIKEEFAAPYRETVKLFMEPIALFFQSITDSCLLEQYHMVCLNYVNDFWILFEKFNVFKRISSDSFTELLNDPETSLHLILGHKKVVRYFDSQIADYMRNSDQSAEIIISFFLERKQGTNNRNSYLPDSLLPKEYETILNRYINSDLPNIGLLRLLAESQSSKECPLSDQLRLNAKRKAAELWKNRFGEGIGFKYGVGICFRSNPNIVSFEKIEPSDFNFIYDADWINDNPDYPTLLNNFIYLFNYVDGCFRCVFLSNQTNITFFEGLLGIKGIKQYDTGVVFTVLDMKSTAEIRAYSSILSSLNIQLEEIIQWFFREYLKNEFSVDGFVINMPSKDSSVLQKCRDLPSEMDGVLKQYKLFVENGTIDRELFEMSSNHCVFNDIPSLVSKKYAYAKNEETKKEMGLLFSTQNLLGYLPKLKHEYNSFWDLLSENVINLSDFEEYEQSLIKWLETRSTIEIDSDGTITPNKKRITILKDLHEHEVICPLYYRNQSLIDEMVEAGDLYYANTLFSIPEQQYLNYMLNKKEYSNGHDLRNKYSHSSYPQDEKQQLQDYYCLLKIMILVVIKINEEFCLKYPQTIVE